MRLRLDTLVDKGCWISHDRMYAFLSADHGITEIGYHGLQPVSKNSRVLVRESGVLSFSIGKSALQRNLQTCDIDWQPSRIEAKTSLESGICSLIIEPAERRLVFRFQLEADAENTIAVRLAKNAFFTEVHGSRTWGAVHLEAHSLLTSFRDRIMLQSWMNLTGPYAGDFLIPEPIRRKIFSSSKRSGLAAREALRPEFQTTDLALYDSTSYLRLGGERFSVCEEPDAWLFERHLRPGENTEFVFECSDVPILHEVRRTHSVATSDSADGLGKPALALDGFPHTEGFFGTVPGLVDSSIVRDFGIPRACPGRYYWIWAWDSLVTMSEALRWGEHRNGEATVRFIEQHRDETGIIPARWTRSLLPLDTPSAGGIEFLQISLAYETFLETGDHELLRMCLASFLARFETVETELLRHGVVAGEGFYPDLLSAFGRTQDSAVCMEIGSWYGFSRILGNIARDLGDQSLADRSETVAASIAQNFDAHFWDEAAGFFIDSLETTTGNRSALHPLFSLLFLQSPLSMQLLRHLLPAMSRFISNELMTDTGVRTLSQSEAGEGGETILDSWYPHWDLYALKLLRRTGDAKSIIRWLTCAERVLSQLGYCPEFLALKGFREHDPAAWAHHGSASNLNCVTSWFRGLRESVAGFEFDPGGITHLPLSLPLPAVRIDGIRWRGGTWSLESLYEGPFFEDLIVDGTVIEGCTKVPLRFHTPGNHSVVARYGNHQPRACFTEFVNARLLSSRRQNDILEATIESLGSSEVAFFSTAAPAVFIDGQRVSVEWNHDSGQGFFSLQTVVRCTVRLQQT